MPSSLAQDAKHLEATDAPREACEGQDASDSAAAAAATAETAAPAAPAAAAKAAAAKKKKKKKKSSTSGDTVKSLGFLPAVDNSNLRCLGSWLEIRPSAQTTPPTKAIREIYPDGSFPKGEVQLYASAPKEAEAREAERFAAVDLEGLREAAECHRQVRRYAQTLITPGVSLTSLCESLESKTLQLVEAAGIERGRGFPTGCSLNECAAHYTPNPGEDKFLTKGDICKLDFGVQVRGRIIDCAFSIAFDPKFDPLIQATKDGTNVGLRAAGVDARLSEIGGLIEEAICSYEFDTGSGTIPIKPIRNLTGHSIAPYRIHAGKSVPIVKSPHASTSPLNIMEAGEVYAVETFASTGKGFVTDSGETSHFMKDFGSGFVPLRLKSARDLLRCIDEHFGTLAFCRRWLDAIGCVHHQMSLQQLVKAGIVVPYPPLSDIPGSFTSQMEHTVFIGEHAKEILSRGPDF